MDLEFWDSHAGLYELCFQPVDVACHRLHFFTRFHAVKDLIDGVNDDEFAKALCSNFEAGHCWETIKRELEPNYPGADYLGYCVLRPISSFVVSRTAVRFDKRPGELISRFVPLLRIERKASPFLRVRNRGTVVHLLNARMELEDPEFIQQDPHLGACATASLWVATRAVTGGVPGTARFPFSTITKQAIGAWGATQSQKISYEPGATEPGLTAEEIKLAISQTGWHPFEDNPSRWVETEAEAERLKHIAFAFVDSGFPVLFCMFGERTGHVVAAVGYSLPSTMRVDRLRPAASFLASRMQGTRVPDERHFLVASAVRLYYTHDDRYGPYNRVHFAPLRRCCDRKSVRAASADGFQRPQVTVGRVPRERMRLTRILVPLPPDVRNPPDAVLIDALSSFDVSGFEDAYSDPVFVWRLVLVLGASFKCWVATRASPNELKAWYASLHLPKFVWLAEFSAVERPDLQSVISTGDDRIIDGEFLYDATAPYHELHRLSARVAGQCWDCRMDQTLTPTVQAGFRTTSYRAEQPS